MLLVGGLAVPATSAPPGIGKNWVNCYKEDGQFTVIHKGDTIDGLSIPQGKWKIWAKYIKSCGNAQSKFHNWLARGKTPDSWSFTDTSPRAGKVWRNAKKEITGGRLAGKHKNIQFRYMGQ